MPGEEIRQRERDFYDRQAASSRPGEPPRPLDDYDRALLAALGSVDGLRVLDLGCGRGDLTLELLAAGAEVVALDVSPAMVDLARARAEHFRPEARARFVVAPWRTPGSNRAGSTGSSGSGSSTTPTSGGRHAR